MSYPVGLRGVLEGRPERYAVIDAGTNSVKFDVAERSPDGTPAPGRRPGGAHAARRGPRSDRRDLGRGDRRGPRTPSRAWSPRRDELGARALVAVGTAGLRIARNGADVVAAIRERTGVEIEVISGEEESRLAYIAVLAGLGLKDEPVVVFDTGGGSTQLTFGHGTRVDERFSVEVGAVRFTEQFGLAGAVSVDGARRGTGRDRRGPRHGSTATSAPRRCSGSAARSPT